MYSKPSNPLETLRFILRNPRDAGPRNSAAARPRNVTFALESACFYLDPESAEWRALQYLVRNDQAVFAFGGHDIVRPAIQLALANMERDLGIRG